MSLASSVSCLPLHFLKTNSGLTGVTPVGGSKTSLVICYTSFRSTNFCFLLYSFPFLHDNEWCFQANVNLPRITRTNTIQLHVGWDTDNVIKLFGNAYIKTLLGIRNQRWVYNIKMNLTGPVNIMWNAGLLRSKVMVFWHVRPCSSVRQVPTFQGSAVSIFFRLFSPSPRIVQVQLSFSSFSINLSPSCSSPSRSSPSLSVLGGTTVCSGIWQTPALPSHKSQ